MSKRVPINRELRWKISPFAIKLWAQILELQQQPRDQHGELASDADRDALRDAWFALAAEIGANKFLHEPHRVIGIQPWSWTRDPGQLRNWEESRQIRDLLNFALLGQPRVAPG